MKDVSLRVVLTLVLCVSARGQAILTFSGGSGSPLTLALAQPVSYTINVNAVAGEAPAFVFDGVGDVFNNTLSNAAGSITFTINGGAPQSISHINSGVIAGSATADDMYIYGTLPALTAGDSITLNAGTSTTTSDVAAPVPTAGSFNSFITNGNGIPLSSFGVVVPEPQAGALLALVGIASFAVRYCHRRGR